MLVDGVMNVHDNPFGILTNEPSFPWQLANLRKKDVDTIVADWVNAPVELAEMQPSAYPNRSMEAVIGMVLRDENGEVAEEYPMVITGLALPNSMKPYVNKGCVKSVVLWNPSDLGYAATQVLRAAIDGTLKPGATSVKAGKLGELQIVNGSEVLLGSPTVFTKDNINQFDF